MGPHFKTATLASLLAGILALPFAGVHITDGLKGLLVEWHLYEVLCVMAVVFVVRVLLEALNEHSSWLVTIVSLLTFFGCFWLPFPTGFIKVAALAGFLALTLKAVYTLARHYFLRLSMQPLREKLALRWGWMAPTKNLTLLSFIFLALAILFPFTPLANRYALDVAIMLLTYIMLAWGLNITVGYAGLLDLGYAGYYALGAYMYALLAVHCQLSFWLALPLAASFTAAIAFVVGLPVLRLRGDYFAVVTLGFGEIVRLVITNWTTFTGGPNGITGIPRPKLFGMEFARTADQGVKLFHETMGIPFDPIQKVYFLYAIILFLAVFVGFFSAQLRRTPLGRTWEAFREDEIACASLGINRWRIKLAAYSLGAAVAGMAGTFFAARQGFISPESFTFTESATMLAIVILGGIGHPLGIVLAAVFIIGLPELFRELEQYRMLAFGAGLVLVMIGRPGGMMATREPSVILKEQEATLSS